MLLGSVALFAVLGLLLFLYPHARQAKTYDLERLHRMLDSHVTAISDWDDLPPLHGQKPLPMPLENISAHFLNALVTREDRRFYRHRGVDLRGIARATLRNVKEGRVVQGASTLTMQLARNAYGMEEKNLSRKLTEAFLARRIEKEFSKQEILELYVNWTFFGDAFHGIERIARAYFHKQAADLTLAESALLAGILRAPNRFSPVKNLRGAHQEKRVVLGRLLEDERITEDQWNAALKENPQVYNPELWDQEAAFDPRRGGRALKATPYKN